MSQIHVSSERTIAAPPDRVYRYIADFRQHHPRFLPPAFSNFQVEHGGVGEGTVVSYQLKAGGRTRTYRVRIAEPEPGRVLTESDVASSLVTTFTVTLDGGASRVRIDTKWQGAGGIGGWFERTFAPRILTKLYADELNRLDRYARDQSR